MKTTGPKYAQKEFQKRVENNYVVTLEELSPFQADIKQESIKTSTDCICGHIYSTVLTNCGQEWENLKRIAYLQQKNMIRV